MDSAIFKAYDVRGLCPEQLDPEAALAIGRATARHLGASPIVVGRDMRESGVGLRDALIEGLIGEGADVIDIGRVATPVVYYQTARVNAAGGVMITASHNPGAYNGFKVCGRDAVPIGIESGLRDIRDAALELVGQPAPDATRRRGEVAQSDVLESYCDGLLELFPARPELRVVIDAGNGIAGEAFARLLERLPLDLTRLYFEPDGTFPNHEADPLKPENTQDLCDRVRELGADLGVAFDGDGDRAFFVDEHGDRVPADLVTALLARTLLRGGLLGAESGMSLVYDLRSSRSVAEVARELGADPIRCRVGHAFMKQRMREVGAVFGGELSGHYYFRFPAGYVADDGAAAMMLMLQTLATEGRPLSELWRPLQRYSQSGEVNSKVDDIKLAIERVRGEFPEGAADELDGLTVAFDDWWFNLRPSNTEPLLRLNLEAATDAAVAAHRDRILSVIRG